MRALLVGLILAASAVVFPGCSKKIELPSATVAYDKVRDGDPKPAGGPTKGKKGMGGVSAPP